MPVDIVTSRGAKKNGCALRDRRPHPIGRLGRAQEFAGSVADRNASVLSVAM